MTDDIHTTIRLVRDAKNGDPKAYNLLLERYLDRVISLVNLKLTAKLREKLESDDVVQEVMERAIKVFEKYDIKNEKAFLYWLRVLVQNTIYDLHDYHSADKRDLHLEAKHNASTDSVAKSLIGNLPAGSVWNPASQLRKKEESLELKNAMDSLSDEDKEVIIMHQYEELSFPEISELTGVAADTLRMRFGRAMDKLTDAMTEKSTK